MGGLEGFVKIQRTLVILQVYLYLFKGRTQLMMKPEMHDPACEIAHIQRVRMVGLYDFALPALTC